MAEAIDLTNYGTGPPRIELRDAAGTVHRTIDLPDPHARKFLRKFEAGTSQITLDGTSQRPFELLGFRLLLDFVYNYISRADLEKLIDIINAETLRIIVFPHRDHSFHFEALIDRDFNFQYFGGLKVGYEGTISFISKHLELFDRKTWTTQEDFESAIEISGLDPRAHPDQLELLNPNDDFSSWNPFRWSDESRNGGLVSISDGKLWLQSPAGALRTAAIQGRYSLEGDFDYRVYFSELKFAQLATEEAGLWVRDPNNPGADNVRQKRFSGGTGPSYTYYFSYLEVDDVRKGEVRVVSTDTSGGFRCLRTGDHFKTYTWSGTEWDLRTDYSPGWTGPSQPRIGTSNSHTQYVACKFDNFEAYGITYLPSGYAIYEFDRGTPTNWHRLYWHASKPQNTEIKFQVSPDQGATWYPSATTFYTTSPADLSTIPSSQIIQIKLILETPNTKYTPIIFDFSIQWRP